MSTRSNIKNICEAATYEEASKYAKKIINDFNNEKIPGIDLQCTTDDDVSDIYRYREGIIVDRSFGINGINLIITNNTNNTEINIVKNDNEEYIRISPKGEGYFTILKP